MHQILIGDFWKYIPRSLRFVQLILNFLQVLYPVVTETLRYELGYQNNVTRWIERRPLLFDTSLPVHASNQFLDYDIRVNFRVKNLEISSENK